MWGENSKACMRNTTTVSWSNSINDWFKKASQFYNFLIYTVSQENGHEQVFMHSSKHSSEKHVWVAHIQFFPPLLPSNKRGTWVILYWCLCPLIFCSWTIQQAQLPGDQNIHSSAAQELSLPAYMRHVVTRLHAVRLFIQHIRPAVDDDERSLWNITSTCRHPECICLES